MTSIADALLQHGAVQINPQQPFTFASGIQSPIYCDNRRLISFPDTRRAITQAMATTIERIAPYVDVIAGTATAGIAWAAWVAEALNKPLVYIRKTAKAYGQAKRIEGAFKPHQHVVLIEDLVSTGGSALSAIEALTAASLNTQHCVSIMQYGFPNTTKIFKEKQINLHSLITLTDILNAAEQKLALNTTDLNAVTRWIQNPTEWQPVFANH